MATPVVSEYSWLTDAATSDLASAGCVTLVTGSNVEEVLQAFGDEVTQTSETEPDRVPDGRHLVSVVSTGEALAVLEVNGYEGSQPDVLRAASKSGKAASVFWNVNDLVVFGCARRRRVLCTTELLDADTDGMPKSLLRLLALVEEDDADLVAIGMTMVERFTGVGLSEEAVQASRVNYLISPKVRLPVTGEELVGLEYPSAATVDRVLKASPSARRAIAEWAATEALRAVGLDTEETLHTVTTNFGGAKPATLTSDAMMTITRLGRDAHVAEDLLNSPYGDESARARALFPMVGLRASAGQAVFYACQADTVTAALGALYYAANSVGRDHRGEQLLAKAHDLLHRDPDTWT